MARRFIDRSLRWVALFVVAASALEVLLHAVWACQARIPAIPGSSCAWR